MMMKVDIVLPSPLLKYWKIWPYNRPFFAVFSDPFVLRKTTLNNKGKKLFKHLRYVSYPI